MTTIKLKNGSGAPLAGNLVQGEPALDLTNKRLYTEDSSGTVIEVGTNPGEDVTFADNRKAIFGAGSDLEIFHDGSSTNFIKSSTSNIEVKVNGGGNFKVGDEFGNHLFIVNDNGDVQLKHGSTPALKLATTSTGIDVTGTVTADSLNIDDLQILSGQSTTPSNSGSPLIYKTTSHADYANGDLLIQARSSASRDIYMLTGTTTPVNRLQVNGSGDVSFYDTAGTTEKFFWDSSAESLGIGTSSPAEPLHVQEGSSGITSKAGTVALIEGSGNTKLTIASGTTSTGELLFGSSADNDAGRIIYDHSDDRLQVWTNGSRAVDVDSSGNLLVGSTSASASSSTGFRAYAGGNIFATASGTYAGYFNRLSSFGEVIKILKDGTSVGSIAIQSYGFEINGESNHTGISFASSSWVPNKNGSRVDNTVDLGTSSLRFDDIYATNGTIQTSDRNEKQDIEALSDAEQRVAVACKGLLRKFRWIDAVEAKGDDARIHFGIIAQDLQDAFTAEGLDAGRYAMFISATWWESIEVIPAVEAQEAVVDEEGNVVEEAVEAQEERTVVHTYDTADEAPEGSVERTRLGVRYPQLLAFIIAAI